MAEWKEREKEILRREKEKNLWGKKKKTSPFSFTSLSWQDDNAPVFESQDRRFNSSPGQMFLEKIFYFPDWLAFSFSNIIFSLSPFGMIYDHTIAEHCSVIM